MTQQLEALAANAELDDLRHRIAEIAVEHGGSSVHLFVTAPDGCYHVGMGCECPSCREQVATVAAALQDGSADAYRIDVPKLH